VAAADEQKIRAKIAQLQEWRTYGITTIAAGEVFEIERKRRVRRAAWPRNHGSRPDHAVRFWSIAPCYACRWATIR